MSVGFVEQVATSVTIERGWLSPALAAIGKVAGRVRTPIDGAVTFHSRNGSAWVSHVGYESSLSLAIGDGFDGEALSRFALDREWLGKTVTAAVKGDTKKVADSTSVLLSADRVTVGGFGVPVETSIDLDKLPNSLAVVGEPPLAWMHRGAFLDALEAVKVSVGTDDLLPVLMNVSLTLRDGWVTVATTDRFRLTSVDVPATCAGDGSVRLMLPLAELIAALSYSDTESVELVGTDRDNVFGVSTSDMTYLARVDGDFPRVDALFPDESVIGDAVTVDVKEALRFATKAAALTERNTAATIRATGGTMSVIPGREGATAPDFPVEAHVEPHSGSGLVEFGINPKYLVEALTMCKRYDYVTFHFNKSMSKPVVITTSSDVGRRDVVRHLIMPRRFIS